MSYQIFKIFRAPEEPPLSEEELRHLLWGARIGSEWAVNEISKSNKQIEPTQEKLGGSS